MIDKKGVQPMKQTLFKNNLHDEIRVQELNHKLDTNQREREAFRKSHQEKYKQWLKDKENETA